ncbi:hypothetical protein DYBT9275_05038 [Dyadobacter sp. CECT 9275]|uniref:TonB C-terminal domain-containing protein n=1 Tax=Dyadobacter helix TaxID=2822344 RepID=A0A916N6Y9_9BACT|nr:energy transducer TonB [Dyadobacter sp. CECT 9275]CAG5011848.1 hypothetical protein DYBT9275_05038 [Dyadobacter sp. CECT 9275]
MKKLVLLLTLISSICQGQKIYQPGEVESMAEPAGSGALLNEFISSNVQVPFRSSYQGMNARVFIRGVVETDGSMSAIEIIKGQDSLCNLEAIRVMGLYKAWKPGRVKNEPVRQYVNYSIPFKAATVADFDSTAWAIIMYYDSKFRKLDQPAGAEYRSVLPLDEDGNVKADIVYHQQMGRGKWKEVSRIPFKKEEFWYSHTETPAKDSIAAFRLSVEDNSQLNYVPVKVFQKNGKLLEYRRFTENRKPDLIKSYYLSGLLRERDIFSDSTCMNTKWFPNGQLASLVQKSAGSGEFSEELQIIQAFKPNGEVQVKEGNGWWRIVGNHGKYVEQGEVQMGKRHGKWIGKLADSTVFYKELYDKGKLLEGVSYKDGKERTYQEKMIQPVFQGGMPAFYQFLGQNIVYPADAARKGVSGRVMISFVVCEDGSLCDYKLEKGVKSDIDQEALRVVQKMDGKWNPGVLRGEKVRVKYNLPVNFQLQ